MRNPALLIAALVLLAGCTGTGGAPDNSTNATEGPDVVIDTSILLPTMSIANGTTLSSSDVSLALTFSEPVLITQLRLNNASANITTTDRVHYSFEQELSDGKYVLEATAADAAGNEAPFSLHFTVETSKPEITDIYPADGRTIYSTNPEITVTFSKEVVLIEQKLDGATVLFTTTDNRTFTYRPAVALSRTAHTLRIRAKDAPGNEVSSTTEFVISQETDNTAPVITLLAAQALSDTEARITWTTDEESTSLVAYGRDEDNLAGTKSSGLMVRSHSVTITGLEKETRYYYRALSVDGAGNTAESPIKSFTTTVDTTAPDKITGTSSSNTQKGGQILVKWIKSSADDFGAYYIYRSTSSITDVSDISHYGTVSSQNTTQFLATGLTNGQQYCFAVTAKDESGNENKSPVISSCATPTDATPPNITSVASSVGLSWGKITWNTDESGSTIVLWGTDSSLGNTATGTNGTTSHSVNITGLATGTPYHYKVKSCDAANNCATSEEKSFTTAAPNTAPSVGDVVVTPNPAFNSSQLTCNGTYSDPEDNPEAGSTFRWLRNGVLISGQASKTLPNTFFIKSDIMRCEYTPKDGSLFGSAVNSTDRTISNSPPVLSGGSVNQSTGNVTLGTNTFRYAVTYQDGDNDPPNAVKVAINSTEYTMLELDPADTNFMNGKQYYTDLTLPAGTYTYTFSAKDSDNADAAGDTAQKSGPTVHP